MQVVSWKLKEEKSSEQRNNHLSWMILRDIGICRLKNDIGEKNVIGDLDNNCGNGHLFGMDWGNNSEKSNSGVMDIFRSYLPYKEQKTGQ